MRFTGVVFAAVSFVGSCWAVERTSPLAPTRSLAVPNAPANVKLIVDDRPASFSVSAPARSVVDAAAGETVTSSLYPSFAAAPGASLPSLELCRWRAFAFYEGALAATELKMEEVADVPVSRQGFLNALINKLKVHYAAAADRPVAREPFGNALAFVATALALSRADGAVPGELGLPADVAKKATENKNKFLAEDVIGRATAARYSWDDNLKRLGYVTAWLSRPFAHNDLVEFQTALALAWTVASDAELMAQYKILEGFYRGLAGSAPGTASVTDYYALLGGRDAITVLKEVGTVRTLQAQAKEKGTAFVFIPSLGDAEVELVRRFAKTPGAGSRADALIEVYKGGGAPSAPSGEKPWLDYYEYVLSALVLPTGHPEAKKLSWDDGYQKRLLESFRFGFDQTRGRGAPLPAPAESAGKLVVDLTPAFRLEPLPEYYLRMARALGRLEKLLTTTITPALLNTMQGRREKGNAAEPSLATEAAATRELFYGFYLLSCADLGMTPALNPGEVADQAGAAARAAAWLDGGWRADADMARDVRHIWPLGPVDPADPKKGIVYRCVLGVRQVDIEIKYDAKPSTTVFGTAQPVALRVKPFKATLLVPVVVEVAVPAEKPLTTAEFRKICDEHKTRDAIVAALKEYGKPAPPPPAPEPKKKERKYDTGMVVLIGIMALFLVIILIIIWAGRQRQLYY